MKRRLLFVLYAAALLATGYATARAQASIGLWVGGNPVSASNPLPVQCE